MNQIQEFTELHTAHLEEEDNKAADFYLINPADYKELVNEMYQNGLQPFGTDGKCYIDGVLVICTHTQERGYPVLARQTLSRGK